MFPVAHRLNHKVDVGPGAISSSAGRYAFLDSPRVPERLGGSAWSSMRTALPARAVFGCSCGRGGGLRSVMVPENAIVAGRAGPRRVRCAEWLPAMDRGCRGTGARRPVCFGLIGVSHGELVPGRAALRHIHHSLELRSPPVIQEDTRRRRASTPRIL